MFLEIHSALTVLSCPPACGNEAPVREYLQAVFNTRISKDHQSFYNSQRIIMERYDPIICLGLCQCFFFKVN